MTDATLYGVFHICLRSFLSHQELDRSQYSVITSRQTRLLRVPTLPAFQQVLRDAIANADRFHVRSMAVIVPTRSAADQLRRTLRAGAQSGSTPVIVTRAEWYEWLRLRLEPVPSQGTFIEREVIGELAIRDAVAEGNSPPFDLRPGLVSALLAFYDELGRYRRTTNAFERLVVDDLEPTAEFDRGAQRLLLQTQFLASAFRAYERRLDALSRVDEHTLRTTLLRAECFTPVSEVVVTVPDQGSHPDGLYPADFDLLTRLPSLPLVTLIATEAILESGYRKRLDDWLPGLDEQRVDVAVRRPVIVVPDTVDGRAYFIWRDREEELRAIARETRRRSTEDGLVPSTAAVVVQRPLPYLYLAPSAFDEIDVPTQTGDTLPLATEPYVSFVDLVLELVNTNFCCDAIIALLRSPHFVFQDGHSSPDPRSVGALDRALRVSGFLAGFAELNERSAAWADTTGTRSDALPALRCALAVTIELASLGEPHSVAEHFSTLRLFLERYTGPMGNGSVAARRTAKARDVMLSGLEALEVSHRAVGDRSELVDLVHVRSVVRRWIESQTGLSPESEKGVHLLNATAAVYGVFDDVFLTGLVETDWLVKKARNIFYPSGMLIDLGWPNERDRLRSARASFHDLLGLSRTRVWVSTFTLENDAAVTVSPVLEDLEELTLKRQVAPVASNAIGDDQVELFQARDHGASIDRDLYDRWYAFRCARPGWRADERFRGAVGARPPMRYTVSSLERYLECPFKYFARDVLRLEENEERDNQLALTPQQRGVFLHEVFEAFFRAWQSAGQSPITLANLDDALECFSRVVEQELGGLPVRDRAVVRVWLLGSAVSSGLAERVFVAEIEAETEVVERLLEYPIAGHFEFGDRGERRMVELRGVVDRIDLYADNSFRVIDYKAGHVPQSSHALQLPVYARCAEEQLRAARGGEWRASEAMYVAFGSPRTMLPVPGRDIDEAIKTGEARVCRASTGIETGKYPPRPADLFQCTFCAYPTVCRKDYVEET